MQVTVSLPKAFSVRDHHEFDAHSHLVARLNPDLRVKAIAQGIHVHGGPTVYWGIVHHVNHQPDSETIKTALTEAGFDTNHGGARYDASF
jgi:hypothetical protein